MKRHQRETRAAIFEAKRSAFHDEDDEQDDGEQGCPLTRQAIEAIDAAGEFDAATRASMSHPATGEQSNV